MSKQFDLEQSILSAWHIVDDIDLLYKAMLDDGMSVDDVANCLLGLKYMYSLRFEKTFKDFEEYLREQYTKSGIQCNITSK